MNTALRVLEESLLLKFDRKHRILIVGAGLGGIAMAYRLRQTGLDDISIFERTSMVGGVWRDNVYPGIACDIPSQLYCYTFYPNPDWSCTRAPGAEILNYVHSAAADLDLERHISFNKNVVSCEYSNGEWHVATDDGEHQRFDVVIAATGFLHTPNMPRFEGMQNFEGPVFHSSAWDKSVDVRGKRVAVVGTGSTSVQIVCALVDEVSDLKLFQRTAQWIFPDKNSAIPESDRAAFSKNPELLYKRYDELVSAVNREYGKLFSNVEATRKFYEETCASYLASVEDPELRRKLTPSYELGCKRLIVHDEFYQSVQKDNCDVVVEPIERFETNGIRTSDGVLHEVDVIVLSTGFRAHEYCRSIGLRGEGGLSLDEAWANGVCSFESVTLAGFPNFFMIGGPYSAIGNQSYLTGAELQTAYVLKLLKLMEEAGARALAPTAEAQARFRAENLAGAQGTVWLSGCRSWFLDEQGNLPFWTRRAEAFIDMMDKGPETADYRFIRD